MAYTRPAPINARIAASPSWVGQFIGDSSGAAGATSTGPAAATSVTSLTPGADQAETGTYMIQVVAGYGAGTPDDTENANMGLYVDDTLITALPVVGAIGLFYCTFVLTLTQSHVVSVRVIGNATPGVIYVAGLVPTRIR